MKLQAATAPMAPALEASLLGADECVRPYM